MPFYVIEVNGEEQVVQSLKGYDNPTVLGEVHNPPGMFERWNRGRRRFEKDLIQEERSNKKARARDNDHLLELIEDLQRQINELKNRT